MPRQVDIAPTMAVLGGVQISRECEGGTHLLSSDRGILIFNEDIARVFQGEVCIEYFVKSSLACYNKSSRTAFLRKCVFIKLFELCFILLERCKKTGRASARPVKTILLRRLF